MYQRELRKTIFRQLLLDHGRLSKQTVHCQLALANFWQSQLRFRNSAPALRSREFKPLFTVFQSS
jgi:hypothetical protein